MLEKSEYLLVCLSFNSYSTDGGVAAIASKVSDEFNDELNHIHETDDFEFSLEFCDELDVSADELSPVDGQIQSVFPIFNRDQLQYGGCESGDVDCVIRRNVSIKIPLDQLIIADCEEHSFDNSSSEADESEPTAVRTAYCLWRPKFVESSSQTWKKSRSTGQGSNSRRWKLRDLLLRRSTSDGKGPFVFPAPKKTPVRIKKGEDSSKKDRNSVDGVRKVIKTGQAWPSSPLHEVFYRKSIAEKQGKKKTYLPYRQNIFGFFSGVNW